MPAARAALPPPNRPQSPRPLSLTRALPRSGMTRSPKPVAPRWPYHHLVVEGSPPRVPSGDPQAREIVIERCSRSRRQAFRAATSSSGRRSTRHVPPTPQPQRGIAQLPGGLPRWTIFCSWTGPQKTLSTGYGSSPFSHGRFNITSTVARPLGGRLTETRSFLMGRSSAAGRADALINALSCAGVGYCGDPMRAYSPPASP
jgi:hypothetical protein